MKLPPPGPARVKMAGEERAEGGGAPGDGDSAALGAHPPRLCPPLRPRLRARLGSARRHRGGRGQEEKTAPGDEGEIERAGRRPPAPLRAAGREKSCLRGASASPAASALSARRGTACHSRRARRPTGGGGGARSGGGATSASRPPSPPALPPSAVGAGRGRRR